MAQLDRLLAWNTLGAVAAALRPSVGVLAGVLSSIDPKQGRLHAKSRDVVCNVCPLAAAMPEDPRNRPRSLLRASAGSRCARARLILLDGSIGCLSSVRQRLCGLATCMRAMLTTSPRDGTILPHAGVAASGTGHRAEAGLLAPGVCFLRRAPRRGGRLVRVCDARRAWSVEEDVAHDRQGGSCDAVGGR